MPPALLETPPPLEVPSHPHPKASAPSPRKAPQARPAILKEPAPTARKHPWQSGFVGTRGKGDIFNVNRALIVQFRGDLLKPMSATGTNHHLKCINMVFRAAKPTGIISEDPAESVDTVKVLASEEGVERKPLDVEDTQKSWIWPMMNGNP